MDAQGTPQPDFKPALELLTAKLDTLSSRIENVSTKVDAAAMKAELPKEQKQPWWTTLTAILGIPGLILLMYMQFSQGGEAKANTQKSIAETEKIRTEELKARTDLQAQLETLAEKKSQGIALYQKQLNESLPKLEQTIEKLNAANLAKQQINRDLLTQYVLLWIFILGIGLVFDLISIVWDSAISIPLGIFYSMKWSESKLSARIRRVVNVIVPVLSPVPRILRVAVQLFIFFALFAPLFNQVAANTGSSVKFQNVAHSVRAFRLGEAVGQVRNALFP